MVSKTLNGDQAIAFGALASGIKLVTSYPGSPSSGTVETIIDLAQKHEIYVEWSGNEKIGHECNGRSPDGPQSDSRQRRIGYSFRG
jgi:indolepyruvate ferredoxin oxidoreductase alpha subunit